MMKHKVGIWISNKKIPSKSLIASVEIDEHDIEKLAVSKYLKNHKVDKRLIYSGNLFDTIC